MKKTEFLSALESYLDGLPANERRASVEYYSEMIDERMEDGMDEEDAVGALGSPELAAKQLYASRADSPGVKENGADAGSAQEDTAGKTKPPKESQGAMRTVLLILGFPLWFPLLIAAVMILFALYAVLWSVVFSVWCVFASLALAAAVCIPAAVAGGLAQGFTAALFYAGGCLTISALSIFAFLGARALTRLAARGTARSFTWFLSLFRMKTRR